MNFKRIAPKTKERKMFSGIADAMPLPDLIEVQKRSYDWLFKDGLRELFEEVSPIKDFIGRDLELYFLNYYLDEPKFDENTAKSKNLTFEAPLRVNARLINKRTAETKEQEIYLGDFPLMTDRGTFIINGSERVVVSQLVRSAGVFFTSELTRGRKYFGAKIIPNRGAWLEMETDSSNVIWVKIDRKRKVAVTSLLRAFGYVTDEEIIKKIINTELSEVKKKNIENKYQNILDEYERTGLKGIMSKNAPGMAKTYAEGAFNEKSPAAKEKREQINRIISLFIDDKKRLEQIKSETKYVLSYLEALYLEIPELRFIYPTIDKDLATNEEDGLREVYKRIRPGDLATTDNARSASSNSPKSPPKS